MLQFELDQVVMASQCGEILIILSCDSRKINAVAYGELKLEKIESTNAGSMLGGGGDPVCLSSLVGSVNGRYSLGRAKVFSD
ncbi:hypothetical protein NPIL_379741 [Nephila pilipes]|uniref:Uncharacterized protein n=1 Tax=Nephila pilipes TaxID=299642 RepID=A0A8X6TUS0_NEPPI|nr:hypothetical protein NPIL_379741 [Nephila pilipes]